MVQRRDLVGGGLVAGLASMMAPSAEAPPRPTMTGSRRARSIASAKPSSGSSSRSTSARWRGVSRVRQQQRTWMMSTRKYPDFIEIGLDVWDNIYDWHVVYQQPLNVTRLADGRYAMSFMFTTLLLRPDQNPDFVGYAFDADSQGRAR